MIAPANAPQEEEFVAALKNFPRPFASIAEVDRAMRQLLAQGFGELPMPGSGRTLERWRALAAVGAIDLSLAKIYEGHTDALAILAELSGEKSEGIWAVWAAEPPNARVVFRGDESGGTLTGLKSWCSGAAVVDYAVMSAWNETGEPILVRLAMIQDRLAVDSSEWKAVGMSASTSVSVDCNGVHATPIGHPGDYVARPGFWQGGAGIAAVWYGAAVAIATTLAASEKIPSDPHAAAHLGAIDHSLGATRALLLATAAWIDANPTADAAVPALRLRAAVEATAHEILLRTGRALGPAPLCQNAEHAQRCADLPVFLRQNHAEHDLAALGRKAAHDPAAWTI